MGRCVCGVCGCADICISCGSLNVSLEHPLFVGAMCHGCKVRPMPLLHFTCTGKEEPLAILASLSPCQCFMALFPPPHSNRTHSWSAPTSTTMTATSHTAPSAVEAEKCSCVATTTAAGPYGLNLCVLLCSGNGRVASLGGQDTVFCFTSTETI